MRTCERTPDLDRLEIRLVVIPLLTCRNLDHASSDIPGFITFMIVPVRGAVLKLRTVLNPLTSLVVDVDNQERELPLMDCLALGLCLSRELIASNCLLLLYCSLSCDLKPGAEGVLQRNFLESYSSTITEIEVNGNCTVALVK